MTTMTVNDKKRETIRSLAHVEKVLAFLHDDLENNEDHGTLLPDSVKVTRKHLAFTREYIKHIRHCVEFYQGNNQ